MQVVGISLRLGFEEMITFGGYFGFSKSAMFFTFLGLLFLEGEMVGVYVCMSEVGRTVL